MTSGTGSGTSSSRSIRRDLTIANTAQITRVAPAMIAAAINHIGSIVVFVRLGMAHTGPAVWPPGYRKIHRTTVRNVPPASAAMQWACVTRLSLLEAGGGDLGLLLRLSRRIDHLRRLIEIDINRRRRRQRDVRLSWCCPGATR